MAKKAIAAFAAAALTLTPFAGVLFATNHLQSS